MLVYLVLLLTIYLIYFYYAYVRVIVVTLQSQLKVPGPPADNFFTNIGPLYDTPENMFKALRKWGREHFPIYRTYVAHMSSINLVDPHDFEIVMSDTKHNMKGYLYFMLHNWLGTGLLTSDGQKWQQRRKILTPAFHFNILQEFIKIFQHETQNLVNIFKKECHKSFISVNDYISDFTLNTIGETAMGTNFEGVTVEGQSYKSAVHRMGQILIYRLCRPWLVYWFFYMFTPLYQVERKLVRILHNFTRDVITKRQKNWKKLELNENWTYSKRKRLAMLDLLLSRKFEDGSIDDEGIREEVDTFMFEGHDTTAAAISYVLMLLACHRDTQDQIYDEIQQVLPDLSKIDYHTLQDLKYTERCIKEVLRLYPSVPFIARVLGEDITTHSGYQLKALTMVHLHIYDVHHNPEIYPDPEKFDPDRFLPENCQNRHNFAYVPFSAGPRNCIGQKFAMLEIKTAICGILSEFILEAVDTPQSIKLIADAILRTKESIKVKFVPRQKK